MKGFKAFLIASLLFLSFPFEAACERIGDHLLTAQDGTSFTTGGFYGKPFVLSFAYTSCTHTCGAATASLARIFNAPGSGLGKKFTAVTVGFDTERDTPQAMKDYGSRFTDDFGSWKFASADRKVIDRLIGETGFHFRKVADGFDHPNVAIVAGPDGRVYKKIFGTAIDKGELLGAIEKSLDPRDPGYSEKQGILEILKSFCYTYDEQTGTYRLDYTFLMTVGLGLAVQACMALIIFYVVYSTRKRRNMK